MQYLKGIKCKYKGKSKSVQISRTVKSFEPRSYLISIVGNYDLPGTYFQVYAPSEQSYSTCLKKISNNFNEAKDLIFAAL